MTVSGTDIGVAIVSFQSADIIANCLSSLAASQQVRLRIVVLDNCSSDDTCGTIRQWAAEHSETMSFEEAELGEIDRAQADLTLLRAPINGGFAYGTNRAIELLLGDPALQLFWMLNPDCEILPDTAAHFLANGREGGFSLMGGRTVFLARPDTIQTDGGRVSRWTGMCESINSGCPLEGTHMHDVATVDFITGANCVASRQFIKQAGLMEEDYFLYYEEVDWAFRRGELPLRQVPEALILHHGGTAIGSGTVGRAPSPFSNYFNHRNRIRFVRRFMPLALPIALAHGLAKSLQLALRGDRAEAQAVITGLLGRPPPAAIAARVSDTARALAFGANG